MAPDGFCGSAIVRTKEIVSTDEDCLALQTFVRTLAERNDVSVTWFWLLPEEKTTNTITLHTDVLVHTKEVHNRETKVFIPCNPKALKAFQDFFQEPGATWTLGKSFYKGDPKLIEDTYKFMAENSFSYENLQI